MLLISLCGLCFGVYFLLFAGFSVVLGYLTCLIVLCYSDLYGMVLFVNVMFY